MDYSLAVKGTKPPHTRRPGFFTSRSPTACPNRSISDLAGGRRPGPMAPGGCGPDRAARTTRHSQGLGKHNKPLIITVSPRKPVIPLWSPASSVPGLSAGLSLLPVFRSFASITCNSKNNPLHVGPVCYSHTNGRAAVLQPRRPSAAAFLLRRLDRPEEPSPRGPRRSGLPHEPPETLPSFLSFCVF